MSSEQHLVTPLIYRLAPSRHKKFEDILPLLWKSVNYLGEAEAFPTLNSSSAFYPATCQTLSQTLCKEVKLLVRYLMFQCCRNPCHLVSRFP